MLLALLLGFDERKNLWISLGKLFSTFVLLHFGVSRMHKQEGSPREGGARRTMLRGNQQIKENTEKARQK